MLWRWRIDRQSAYLAGRERSIEAERYAAATTTRAKVIDLRSMN
jgi:hypothetical protein